jgi:hypothetical protein
MQWWQRRQANCSKGPNLLADVLAEGVPRAAGGDAPAAAVVGVAPQQVAHGAFVRHLRVSVSYRLRHIHAEVSTLSPPRCWHASEHRHPLGARAAFCLQHGTAAICFQDTKTPHLLDAVQRPDVVQGVQGRRQAAVQTEHLRETAAQW